MTDPTQIDAARDVRLPTAAGDVVLQASPPGGGLETSFHSWDIADRRPLYRRLDRLLGDDRERNKREWPDDPGWYRWLDRRLGSGWLGRHLPLRYVPAECSRYILDGSAPPAEQPTAGRVDYPRVWNTMYEEAAALVRHDDALNWGKFNNLVVLNGALLTGYGVAVQFAVIPLLVIFPLFGMALSWLFDFTLQEGMRCLRAHREKVRALERKVVDQSDGRGEFLFLDNPYNQRDALEIGPLLLTVLWTVCLGLTPVGVAAGWFTSPRGPVPAASAPAVPAAPAAPQPAPTPPPRPAAGGALPG